MADMNTASGYKLLHEHTQRTKHMVHVYADEMYCSVCLFALRRKTSGWDELEL